MSEVRLVNLKKEYKGGVAAVKGVNLEIARGEFLVLVGPSGSGKSTILRMIAGLEEISGGDIYIGEQKMNEVPPRDRDIAMVFQDFALYPHMNVYDNISFGLKMRKMPKDNIHRRVTEAAKTLDIENLLERKPRQLSGGEKQRVALGRAIVRQPKVFLMDEPLSNLDAKLRVQMRIEILRLYRKLNTTVIYVTHDQTEAMTMGTRIAVMKDGVVQQLAVPGEIYTNPVNTFVASFIGTPAMNFLRGRLQGEGDSLKLFLAESSIELPPGAARQYTAGMEISAGIRPEHIAFTTVPPAADGYIPGEVEIVENMGSDYGVSVITADGSLMVKIPAGNLPQPGGKVYLGLPPAKILLFESKTGNRLN